MTISYLESHGGEVLQKKSWWNLKWPDGTQHTKAVFNSSDADLFNAKLLNLENPRIRGLVLNLPPIAAGQPIPLVHIKDLPETITGYWGLYEIRISSSNLQNHSTLRTSLTRRCFISVFTNEDGKVFLPTARHIWNGINDSEITISGSLSMSDSKNAFEWLRDVAEDSGKNHFDELMQEHTNSLSKESERAEYAFEHRQKANKRIGLPEVRNYRNIKLKEEIAEWQRDLKLARQVIPEIRPLLVMKIGKGERDE